MHPTLDIIDKLSIHNSESHVQAKQGRDICLRGSPRPRGYVHQFVIHFIALLNRVITMSRHTHGQFTLPQGSSQRASCNSTALF